MTILEIAAGSGGLIVILMSLIQLSPLKINPWSWFGRVINADIMKKLDDHITMDNRRTADAHRMRILHFNNELLRDIPHTKEEFLEVLSEIDDYERYCREDKDYKNNRAVLAIANIKESYMERLHKHDFLQEGVPKGTAV